MTRTLLLASLLATAFPSAVHSQSVSFNDPAHIHFFRYQNHLNKIGLQGETEQSWGKQKPSEQIKKIFAGEDFLKNKFQELMVKDGLSTEETALLEDVWGREILSAVGKVHLARSTGDGAQIEAAVKNVDSLSKKLGNLDMDWQAIFDGRKPGEVVDPSRKHDKEDFLKVTPQAGFLDSLETPEVRRALATQKSFAQFLHNHHVPVEAMPGMLAMYANLSQASSEEKKELGHILPTVARFLLDGKKIILENLEGAAAFAVPGDYDKPEKVGITSSLKTTHPIVVGSAITHEFQHIYDMYAGRYYTMDSELRGFKAEIVYAQILKKAAPAQYDAMMNNDDDSTRGYFRERETSDKALRESPEAFYKFVGFNYDYSHWYEGVFMGRAPLREAIDPNTGAPRQLQAFQALLERYKTETAQLERNQSEIRAKRDKQSSRELDRELEKATRDLGNHRAYMSTLDTRIAITEIRIRRMQSEVDWLNKKSQEKGQPHQPFDLSLPVDKDYVLP